MYSQQMNDIMASIEFFNGVYGKPMANGINFKTNNFKDNFSHEDFILHYENSTPDVYAYYQQLVEKAYNFKDALAQYVASDDFLEKWNNFIKKEKIYIIYFDSDSYITLRAKLPSHEIMPINWDDIVKNTHFKWDEKTMKTLSMPEELYNPPMNKLQALKQRKALFAMDYSQKNVDKVYQALNHDAMTNNLFGMILEKIPKDELTNVLHNLGVNYAGWHSYTINFIKEEEEKLQKRAKPRI